MKNVVDFTAFCPKTVHRIPSDAFARTARIMYVGSIYFTSAEIPISLKYFFVYILYKIERSVCFVNRPSWILIKEIHNRTSC